ncbi:MAG: virulence factor [Pseudomonadota bacterium]|nr:virulence factor [Pseudomonadota bacterium]
MIRKTKKRTRRGVIVTAIVSAIIIGMVAAAGYFDRSPLNFYAAVGRPRETVVVNVSGDMGLRFLLGASTSRGLTQRGYSVVGVSAPGIFWRRRTRAEIATVIADAIRFALAKTGARNVAVMGQSYGADIVQTGLVDLPADLRRHVVAIVLVLPGDSVFFRADPTGLLYRGKPDSIATATANTLDWAPVTCIYGVEETDSLCPLLRIATANIVSMPGDHDIRHDAAGLLANVLQGISRPAIKH